MVYLEEMLAFKENQRHTMAFETEDLAEDAVIVNAPRLFKNLMRL